MGCETIVNNKRSLTPLPNLLIIFTLAEAGEEREIIQSHTKLGYHMF